MINYIDSKYISLLCGRLEGMKKVGDNYNFRCPMCGDSAKNKSKKRGWILTGKTHPAFYCHNCNASLSFSAFLKAIDLTLYKEYVFELLKERSGEIKELVPLVPVPSRVFETPTEHNLYTQAFLSVCTPLNELPPEHPANEYIRNRLVPEEKKRLLYFIDNVQNISKIDKAGKYNNRIIDTDSRIVIPIWSKDSLIGVSCRALESKAQRRYLIFKFEEELPLIFGLYDINGKLLLDPKKPVYITEGGMDSLFLENAVAVNGADLKRVLKMLAGLDLRFVPDNEPRNKEIVNVYKQIIASNNSIVIFPDSVTEKDINEAVLRFGIYSVKCFINNNTFKGLPATLRLNEWKRV